jgi:hypothetical protein
METAPSRFLFVHVRSILPTLTDITVFADTITYPNHIPNRIVCARKRTLRLLVFPGIPGRT